MKRKRITVSVISEITTDQRVIRICATLREMGFDVFLIGRAFGNSLPLGTYTFHARRMRCYFRKGVLQYAEFNLRLFFRLLFCKTDYLLANDLDTLAPNYIVSKWRKKFLFYDTHEYFTGVPELAGSPAKKRFWKRLEDAIFPRLKVVYTVSDAVKSKYQAAYGIPISVVRNLPVPPPPSSMARPAAWAGKRVLLMQGIGINHGRGGLESLEMMRYLPEDYYLVYIGGGLLWEQIREKRREWALEHCVEMIDKLPPDQLKHYTPHADLGLSLDGFTDENFLVSLPNKLFDYILAGIPVAATPLPEVKKIIEQYGVGFCLNNRTPKEMAAEIARFLDDAENLQKVKANVLKAQKELNWNQEKQVLIKIYEPYL
ncbi:glycosyltransferase [Niabella sp. CC-SYL272]|uniref:glycosyltransferase n=1 Tax=Niabella agricola TaxID=2891571 RepID=UPI001F2EEFD8|nr:glycosyltransferase [Niabella agricola]MCF3107933.1 glycosyltransferase [Niabella agricola]